MTSSKDPAPVLPSFAEVAAEGPDEALRQEHEAVDRVEEGAADLAASGGYPLPDPDAPSADEVPSDGQDTSVDTSSIIASMPPD